MLSLIRKILGYPNYREAKIFRFRAHERQWLMRDVLYDANRPRTWAANRLGALRGIETVPIDVEILGIIDHEDDDD